MSVDFGILFFYHLFSSIGFVSLAVALGIAGRALLQCRRPPTFVYPLGVAGACIGFMYHHWALWRLDRDPAAVDDRLVAFAMFGICLSALFLMAKLYGRLAPIAIGTPILIAAILTVSYII